MSFYSEIIDIILSQEISSKQEIHRLKIKLCKKYGYTQIPSNSEIIHHIPQSLSPQDKIFLIKALRKKPMRTISGVAVVAVMTSPAECPHGRCVPCPGGPPTQSPQSYTGFEPAAMRGSLNHFDPFKQVKARIEQLTAIGHPTDKIDLIIMGGTFTARDLYYQEWFVKRCFDAMNNSNGLDLDSAKQSNETSNHRCIGLTVETRPDWFRLQQMDQSLQFGATRVELGVQSIYDDVLYSMNRGHTVSDTIFATRLAKESGLKICYHMMPGLPKSNEEKDISGFKELFSNPNFQPDMLKIYPTLVIKNTPLYTQWKEGIYNPLTTEEAVNRISKMLSYVPEYVRIQRIQRDVPAQYIEGGVQKSNLRQFVDKKMRENKLKSMDIRSREVGHKTLRGQHESRKISIDGVVLKKISYEASNGTEIFLSLVLPSENALVGYLRLRDLQNPHRYELQKHPSMIIRELKIVGQEIGIKNSSEEGLQHQGFGKQLVREAERICYEDFEKHHLFILSGIGVKEYYRNYLNYKDDGLYLHKKI
jgi:elongator complex protein 3